MTYVSLISSLIALESTTRIYDIKGILHPGTCSSTKHAARVFNNVSTEPWNFFEYACVSTYKAHLSRFFLISTCHFCFCYLFFLGLIIARLNIPLETWCTISRSIIFSNLCLQSNHHCDTKSLSPSSCQCSLISKLEINVGFFSIIFPNSIHREYNWWENSTTFHNFPPIYL